MMNEFFQNTDAPLVSVVMPVFNHPASRLRQAVRSILNQTYSRFELIIIDGHLTDANLEIVKEFADPRIVYCRAKGYINCLNLGMKKAAGDYIARMDSDDISYPRRLEEQVFFLEQNPDVGLCSCQAEIFGDTKPCVTKNAADIDFITYVKTGQILHPAIMFRRELNVEFDAVKPCEDCLLFRKLLLSGCVIKNLDKVLFKNRVNRNSIMVRRPKLMELLMAKINLYAFSRLPRLRGILNFSETILDKRSFMISDFSSFFKFVGEMKKLDAVYGINTLSMFRPFLDYMISHSLNRVSVYLYLITTPLFYTFYRPFKKIVQLIFSIRNKRLSNGRKIKVMTIFGAEIKLKK